MEYGTENELIEAYVKQVTKNKYCSLLEFEIDKRIFPIREFIMPKYGRADVVYIDFSYNPYDKLLYGMVGILEFKNRKLIEDDIRQINRYVEGMKYSIQKAFKVNLDDPDGPTNITIIPALIGRYCHFTPHEEYLADSIDNLRIATHEIVDLELQITEIEEREEIEYPELNEVFWNFFKKIKKEVSND